MPRYQTCTPACLRRTTFAFLWSCSTKSAGHADDEVELAGEELGEPRLVLDDGPEHHAVVLHRTLPVVGFFSSTTRWPRSQLANRNGPVPTGLQRVVGAPLHHGGGAHDRRGAGGEDGQERRARLLQEERDAIVADLDRLHVAEEVVGERILAELVGGMLGVDLALDRELHRRRVERRAVVEPDALAQLERVLQAVLRDRPGLREPGDDLRLLLGERDERLDDAAGHAIRVQVGHLRRVEVHGLRDERHERVPAGCAPAGRGAEPAERPTIATMTASHSRACVMRGLREVRVGRTVAPRYTTGPGGRNRLGVASASPGVRWTTGAPRCPPLGLARSSGAWTMVPAVFRAGDQATMPT